MSAGYLLLPWKKIFCLDPILIVDESQMWRMTRRAYNSCSTIVRLYLCRNDLNNFLQSLQGISEREGRHPRHRSLLYKRGFLQSRTCVTHIFELVLLHSAIVPYQSCDEALLGTHTNRLVCHAVVLRTRVQKDFCPSKNVKKNTIIVCLMLMIKWAWKAVHVLILSLGMHGKWAQESTMFECFSNLCRISKSHMAAFLSCGRKHWKVWRWPCMNISNDICSQTKIRVKNFPLQGSVTKKQPTEWQQRIVFGVFELSSKLFAFQVIIPHSGIMTKLQLNCLEKQHHTTGSSKVFSFVKIVDFHIFLVKQSCCKQNLCRQCNLSHFQTVDLMLQRMIYFLTSIGF